MQQLVESVPPAAEARASTGLAARVEPEANPWAPPHRPEPEQVTSLGRRTQRIDSRLRITSAQVLYDPIGFKYLRARPVRRSFASNSDPLAGLQIGTAGHQGIGLMFLLIDQT
jgi:hypothetical protein